MRLLFIGILLFVIYMLFHCKCKYMEHYTDEHIKLSKNKVKELVTCMKRFGDLCDDNKLYYIISFGTLLGSIRHKGLIPWDDDIDLIMYFKDMDQIKNVLNKLSDMYGYKIYHEWKLSRIYIDDNIFIDIFYVQNNNNIIERCGIDDVGLCFVPDKIENWWHKWFNYPAKYMSKRALYEFEGEQFYGPIEGKKLLEFWYGSDYMETCKTHYLKNHNEVVKQDNIKCYYEGSIMI